MKSLFFAFTFIFASVGFARSVCIVQPLSKYYQISSGAAQNVSPIINVSCSEASFSYVFTSKQSEVPSDVEIAQVLNHLLEQGFSIASQDSQRAYTLTK